MAGARGLVAINTGVRASVLIRVEHEPLAVLGRVHQRGSHGAPLVPGHDLETHEPRLDGLGELDHHLLIANGVALKNAAVSNVRVFAVELVAREHLELRHHLVAASARLRHNTLNGHLLSGVNGHPLARAAVLSDPSNTRVQHALRVASALPVAAVNRRVFTGELGRVVDGERQFITRDGRLLGAGHDEQTSAQGDTAGPLDGFNLHVPRLHWLGEVRLDVRVVSDVVLEHLAAVNVMERAALEVRDLHLELRHVLGAVSASLRHDTGNVHDNTGIHGVCLTSDVAPGEPAMLAVEHAGVVAVAGNVVGVRARRVPSVIRWVEHLGQSRQRRHAIAGLNLFRERITTEGLHRALNVLAA